MPSVEESIFARLAGDTAVTSLIGDRIYPGKIPDYEDPIPWVRYVVTESTPKKRLDGTHQYVDHVVEFDSPALTYELARSVSDAIRISLDGYQGGQIQWAVWERSAVEEADDDGYQIQLTLKVRATDATALPTAAGLPRLELREDGVYYGGAELALVSELPPAYTLPIASAGTLGGVRVGSGLSIDEAGILSAAGGMTIGAAVANGTASRVLYVGAGGVLAEDAGLKYVSGRLTTQRGLRIEAGPANEYQISWDHGANYPTGLRFISNGSEVARLQDNHTLYCGTFAVWGDVFTVSSAGFARSGSGAVTVMDPTGGGTVFRLAGRSLTGPKLDITGRSSTTDDRPMLLISPSWADSTDATRRSRVAYCVYAAGTAQEAFQAEADPAGVRLGFFGTTPAARPSLPSAGAVTAADIRTALITLGLCQ